MIKFIFVAEPLSVVFPPDSTAPQRRHEKPPNKYVIPIIVTVTAIILLVVLALAFVFSKKVQRRQKRPRRGTPVEKENERNGNVHRNDIAMKYNGYRGQLVSANSSTAPLLYNGSIRSGTESSISGTYRFKGQPLMLSHGTEGTYLFSFDLHGRGVTGVLWRAETGLLGCGNAEVKHRFCRKRIVYLFTALADS